MLQESHAYNLPFAVPGPVSAEREVKYKGSIYSVYAQGRKVKKKERSIQNIPSINPMMQSHFLRQVLQLVFRPLRDLYAW